MSWLPQLAGWWMDTAEELITIMLKIKLTRTGKRNQAHYRVVVSEARSKNRGGKVSDILGYYNPADPENRLVINSDRYKVWLQRGAQPTQTIRQLVAKLS